MVAVCKGEMGELALTNNLRGLVKNGAIPLFALWNPIDQADLAVYMAHALLRGEINAEPYDVISAGRLGQFIIMDINEMLLGPPTIFDSSNINSFNF